MHAHLFRTLPLLLAVVQPGWAAEPVAPQDQAPGFIDGSHLGLNLRHYYSNQHTQRSTHLVIKKHGVAQPTRERDTWVQTGMLNYSSGYTQGLVGFGVDASLFSAVTLERGHGAVASGVVGAPAQRRREA